MKKEKKSKWPFFVYQLPEPIGEQKKKSLDFHASQEADEIKNGHLSRAMN